MDPKHHPIPPSLNLCPLTANAGLRSRSLQLRPRPRRFQAPRGEDFVVRAGGVVGGEEVYGYGV